MKMKEFMDKPITWGGYLKLCAGCYVASLVITGAVYGKFVYDIKKYRKNLEKEIRSDYEDNIIEFGL